MGRFHALFDSEIIQALHGSPSFRGVFTKDRLPTRPRRFESLVVNMDDHDGPGTHWVTIYKDPKKRYVEYFDPFGAPPPIQVVSYLNKSNKKIIFNDSQIQDLRSVACGYYSIYYIRQRDKHKTPYDIIYKFSHRTTKTNDKTLKKYFAV